MCIYMLCNADIGAVSDGLKYHLQKCLKSPTNHYSILLQILKSCIHFTLSQCLEHHHRQHKPVNVFLPICGVINTGRVLYDQQWIIRVFPVYSLQINFLEFHLPSSEKCTKASLQIPAPEQIGLQQGVHIYCGKHNPWYINMLNHTAYMLYSANGFVYRGFHFTAVFKALDPASRSVHVSQNTYIIYQNILRFSAVTEATFVETKMPTINNKFHFYARAGYVVCIRIFYGDIQMFDGPGTRSHKMQVMTNKRMCFTSFLGYMEISNIVQNANSTESRFKQVMTRKAHEFMIYRSQPAHITSAKCGNSSSGSASHLFTAASTAHDNIQCIWEVDGMDREVHIN